MVLLDEECPRRCPAKMLLHSEVEWLLDQGGKKGELENFSVTLFSVLQIGSFAVVDGPETTSSLIVIVFDGLCSIGISELRGWFGSGREAGQNTKRETERAGSFHA